MEDTALIPVDSIQRALAPGAIRLYHPFWNGTTAFQTRTKAQGATR